MHADDIIRKWHPTQSPWLQYMYIQLTVCTLLVQPHFGHLSCVLVVCMIHHKIERMLPNRWIQSVVTFMKTNKSASWYIVLVLLSFCTSGLEGLSCRGIGKTCKVCRFFDLHILQSFLVACLCRNVRNVAKYRASPHGRSQLKHQWFNYPRARAHPGCEVYVCCRRVPNPFASSLRPCFVDASPTVEKAVSCYRCQRSAAFSRRLQHR